MADDQARRAGRVAVAASFEAERPGLVHAVFQVSTVEEVHTAAERVGLRQHAVVARGDVAATVEAAIAARVKVPKAVGGLILPARAQVQAVHRIGIGRAGNVGPDSITAPVSSNPAIASVSNPFATEGGAERETIDEAKISGPGSGFHLRIDPDGDDPASEVTLELEVGPGHRKHGAERDLDVLGLLARDRRTTTASTWSNANTGARDRVR